MDEWPQGYSKRIINRPRSLFSQSPPPASDCGPMLVLEEPILAMAPTNDGSTIVLTASEAYYVTPDDGGLIITRL